jgi:steroid 5-alpha reductase family enzyme
MIKNRFLSLSVIILVYAIAIAGGLFLYNYLEQAGRFSYPIRLLLADVFATVIVFIFSLIFANASVYDPYWSVQPPVILGVVLIKCGASLFGWSVFAAVLLWGLRLTANWAYNFKSFEYQDWRYTMLKEKTGRLYPFVNFLGIHLFPTLVVYLCIVPAVIAVHEGATLNFFSAPFLLLSFAAPVFQGIADIQMHRFRNDKSPDRGNFIRTGLWKKSRHPNYACEILMWWGIAWTSFFSMPVSGASWFLLCGALVNTFMFLFVSIPMADKRQSLKPGFDEYKKATRML